MARAGLFRKYAVVIVLLVGGSLLLSGALQAYTSYDQAREALQRIELEQATSAAARIGAFVRRIETQLHWVMAPAGVGDIGTIDRVRGYERLLTEEPAVTDVSYLEASGREFVSVSRVAPTVLGRGTDLSGDQRFREALARGIYYGPVVFRDGSEPYMAVAVAEPTGGVTLAQVNLKLIREVVLPIKAGDAGHAYVVDGRGLLIAHPDLSLVLRRTDLSTLSQVRAALGGAVPRAALVGTDAMGRSVLTAYERMDPPGWTVFVEQPLDEAFAPLYEAIARSALLVLVALVLAVIAAGFLARRMARPILALRASADRIGAGALDERIDLHTGDEIESLAAAFNTMASRVQESRATLEQKVNDRTQELEEVNRTLEARVAAQVNEMLALRGIGGTGIFRREGEMWIIAFEGSAIRLRDTKGLHYLAALIREPGRERHALDLVSNGGSGAARPAGDAGPLLDAEAKAQYKARLEEISLEIAAAERGNDHESAARAQEEREALLGELAAAVGLGGRDRRAASDTERARINVTRAIKAVMDRVAEQSPALGAHLAATVRTGQYCVYVPDPRNPFRWET